MTRVASALLALLGLLVLLLPAPAAHAHADDLRLDADASGGVISVDWKDAQLVDALRLIARVGNVNLVLDPAAQGRTLTLALHRVPWTQALELVTSTAGFGVVLEGNVARVAPMNALIQERQQKAQLAEAQRLAAPLTTVAFPLSWTSAAAAEAIVRKNLSPRGSTQFDARTNTLLVTDVFDGPALQSVFIPGLTIVPGSRAAPRGHEVTVRLLGIVDGPILGVHSSPAPEGAPGGPGDDARAMRLDLAVGQRVDVPGAPGLTMGLERDGSRLVVVARAGRVGAQVPAEGRQAMALRLASGREALLVVDEAAWY